MTEGDGWERYGPGITGAMAEVLEELPEEARPHALETADCWLSVGLVIGLERPADAIRLLGQWAGSASASARQDQGA